MTERDGDQVIRILHLSDTHFTAGKAWDADPVLRALARFIADEVKQGLVPDLVAFTGDLAFSGKAEEYALARKWLDDLWTMLNGLPRDRLLLVPGNHDVDRSKVTKGVRMMQEALINGRSQEDIADLLRDKDQRSSMLKRHASYFNFVRGWLGQPQTLPWWQRLMTMRQQQKKNGQLPLY